MLQLARGTTAIEAVKTMLPPVLPFLPIRFSRDLLLGQGAGTVIELWRSLF